MIYVPCCPETYLFALDTTTILPRLAVKVILAIYRVNAVRAALSLNVGPSVDVQTASPIELQYTLFASLNPSVNNLSQILALEDKRMTSAAANRGVLAQILTNVVLASISQPGYSVDPPKLSPELWDRVCVLTPDAVAENERLEFLGDALMDACFGIELYKRIPDGTPHMYTVSRGLYILLSISSGISQLGLKQNFQGNTLRPPSQPVVLPSCKPYGYNNQRTYEEHRRCFRNAYGCILYGEGF